MVAARAGSDSVVRVEHLRLEILAVRSVALALVAALLERDRELLDARTIHLEHIEAHPVVRDVVTDLRRATEQSEHEAGDRVVVLRREIGPEALVEVVDRERAVDL